MSEPSSYALEALYLALRLSLPALAIAFGVSLVLSIAQLVTQLREPALAALPRVIAVGFVVALSAGALSGELLQFAQRVYRALPELVAEP